MRPLPEIYLVALLTSVIYGCGEDNKEVMDEMIESNPNEINCNADFGSPEQSLYVLPYPVGRTFQNEQTFCPPNPSWGHHNWFAYDFNTQIGDTIVAARSGKVILSLLL